MFYTAGTTKARILRRFAEHSRAIPALDSCGPKMLGARLMKLLAALSFVGLTSAACLAGCGSDDTSGAAGAASTPDAAPDAADASSTPDTGDVPDTGDTPDAIESGACLALPDAGSGPGCDVGPPGCNNPTANGCAWVNGTYACVRLCSSDDTCPIGAYTGTCTGFSDDGCEKYCKP